MDDERAVAEAVRDIAGSPKYRHVAPETVADVVAHEFARTNDPREAVARARKRLHRAVQGYLGEPKNRELTALEAAFAAGGDEAIRTACRAIMQRHFSSRERLPILDRFYRELFAVTGTPRSIADLACSMNPFAFRWMGLPAGTVYRAYDFNRRYVDFLDRYFRLEAVEGIAEQRDVVCEPPAESCDVALMLKVYDNIEARRSGAGRAAVEGVDAAWAAVSFPVRSMSGRASDFVAKHLPGLLEAAPYELAEVLRFESETVAVLRRGSA